MSEKFYVWRSDAGQVVVREARSAKEAAETYATTYRVPFNVALRVVPVAMVASFGIRVAESVGDES